MYIYIYIYNLKFSYCTQPNSWIFCLIISATKQSQCKIDFNDHQNSKFYILSLEFFSNQSGTAHNSNFSLNFWRKKKLNRIAELQEIPLYSSVFWASKQKVNKKPRNLLKRITGSQAGLGEENSVPRLIWVVLEEENPEKIIGDERFPRLAHHAHFHSVLSFKLSQYLHQYIRR